jgi:quercetin dioxygenase-like cupin family protein
MSRKYAGVWVGCALIASALAAEAVSAQGRGGPPPLVTPADPEGFIIVTPEALTDAFTAGGRQKVLFGNPSAPGLYVVQLQWEPGSGSCPHIHNEARLINVLEGTWYVATGEDARTYKPNEMTPVHAGTFIYEPANGVHYDEAKDQRVVVQIMGIGPVNTTSLMPPNTSCR